MHRKLIRPALLGAAAALALGVSVTAPAAAFAAERAPELGAQCYSTSNAADTLCFERWDKGYAVTVESVQEQSTADAHIQVLDSNGKAIDSKVIEEGERLSVALPTGYQIKLLAPSGVGHDERSVIKIVGASSD